MSTKSSIAYGDSFHLYHELLDGEDDVYLTLCGDVEFDASQHAVTVRIPIHIWEHIRHHGGFTPQYHLMDDEALMALVTKEVDERIQEWVDAGRTGISAIFGAAVYGTSNEPREDQIKQGFEWMSRRRAEEREIVQRIEALKKDQDRER